MKTIGLLGGMSWESTALYYQQINKLIQNNCGKLHSAKIILKSVNFAEIAEFQHHNLWDKAGEYLKEQAILLENAGADCIVLCTNTMHKVSHYIEDSISIPFIHIADATANEILKHKIHNIGLLGTSFTMEQDFYINRLKQKNLNILIPNKEDRVIIHDIIYNELCLGILNQDSKQKYIDIIDKLIVRGAQGIILGCTEIGMLIDNTSFDVPLFDTTSIHVKEAVSFALV